MGGRQSYWPLPGGEEEEERVELQKNARSSRSFRGAAAAAASSLQRPLQVQQGGGGRAAHRRQHLHEGDAVRGEAAQVLRGWRIWAGVGGGERVGAAVVLGGRPGDDVGAVVRARASVLAEVELERDRKSVV